MTDEYIMDPYKMPLARYYQLLRIASKIKAEERQLEEERAAWLGWQIAGHEFQMKNKKPPNLKEWREMVGLAAMDRLRKGKPKEVTEEEKAQIMRQTLAIVEMDESRKASLAKIKADEEAREKSEQAIN